MRFRFVASCFPVLVTCLAALMIVSIGDAVTMLDFEDGSTDAWEFVDEKPENLGDQGPGDWLIRPSELGLDGNVLYQASNIWGTPGDTMLMGTFAIYTGETFSDFMLEIDVAAADNDAMGIVWAYESTAQHYRVNMINDGWPSPPLDGNSGPMLIAHKRISDDDPWYELIDVVRDADYINYPEGPMMHWTLTVQNGGFVFESDHGVTISGSSADYTEGHIGIQLYAQQVEFDNIMITPLGGTAVDPEGKLSSLWGDVKQAR